MSRALAMPLRHNGRALVTVEGVEAERQKLLQVLMTECAPDGTGGELPWRTELGAPLHLLAHKNTSHVAVALARTWATQALARWAPGMRITSLEVTTRGAELWLRIRHRPRGATNDATTTMTAPR